MQYLQWSFVYRKFKFHLASCMSPGNPICQQPSRSEVLVSSSLLHPTTMSHQEERCRQGVVILQTTWLYPNTVLSSPWARPWGDQKPDQYWLACWVIKITSWQWRGNPFVEGQCQGVNSVHLQRPHGRQVRWTCLNLIQVQSPTDSLPVVPRPETFRVSPHSPHRHLAWKPRPASAFAYRLSWPFKAVTTQNKTFVLLREKTCGRF